MSASLLAVTLLVCLSACGAAVSVRLHQNVSLSCELNSSSVVAWFRLSGGRITPLVLASRGRLSSRRLIVEQNEEPGRFHLEDDGRRLLVLEVAHTDLGLYYCATGPSASTLRYGTTITLTHTDAVVSSDRTLLTSACVVCGFGGFLCASLLFYCRGEKHSALVTHVTAASSSSRVSPSGSSAIGRVTENSNVQVQYSSLRWVTRSRAARPAPVDVTYTTVAKHTHTHT